ncbi:alpha/beta fold hydrolase [Oceanobacter kriegii]|uniref:alpha/beta fold hydrolase n=1 Tax=Oceanobacter kriegii TaxID=64972 RepID=UPI0003F926CB|nr:alpha/beta hydrolase [Oceanobacter kriegii]
MWNPWLDNPLLKTSWLQPDYWMQETGALPLEQVQQRWQLPDSRYLEIDGMQVHYRDSADQQDSDKPVLLLLHGLFASLHTWMPWTERLVDDFRVISLDLPNFGLTGPHPKGMVKHLYSDFLAQFINQLNLSHCHVAGNSLGGWMAWEFAARYPQHVDKLVLVDSAGFFFVPPTFMLNLSMPGGGWLYSRSRIDPAVIGELLEQVFHNPELVTQEQKSRYYDMMMREGNRVAAARVMRFIRDQMGFDTTLLDMVTQPTLILWGQDDPWMPVDHAEQFQQKLPHSQLLLYPECGHLPMEENPDVSADDCRRFLLSEAQVSKP